MAKLIREGMDAAEAQDLVDARPLKYPESGSDGEEEEEELESLGGEDFGTNTSLCGMSGPVTPQVSVHLNTYHCTLFNLKRKIGGFNSKRRGQIKVKVYKRN